MEYRHTSSPHPKKFKTMPSAGKILLTVFWDSQRVYMTEFLEAGKTVNSARYIETIKNLWRRVCRVRGSTSRILLLHDNARPHTARANDWCSGDAEVWGSLPFALQPWLGTKRFPFVSSPQEGSQGDSFNLRWISEASCDVEDQTKNSWIRHWRHAYTCFTLEKMYWKTRRLCRKISMWICS
jgi:hypothetical protein